MNCPKCNGEMVEGDAEVHANIWGMLIDTTTTQKLFFHTRGSHPSQEVPVLATAEKMKAWRCPSCEGVFLEQPSWVAGYK